MLVLMLMPVRVLFAQVFAGQEDPRMLIVSRLAPTLKFVVLGVLKRGLGA